MVTNPLPHLGKLWDNSLIWSRFLDLPATGTSKLLVGDPLAPLTYHRPCGTDCARRTVYALDLLFISS